MNKKIRKNIFALMLIVLLSLILFLPYITSAKTGFGPAEIFSNNQRDTLIIGKATIINGDDIPKYGVFSIFRPYSNHETFNVVSTEIVHARVVCNECKNGMQRYEAVNGYVYGDPLQGICEVCGSNNLTFYCPMPRDEYDYLSLEGAENFNLEKIGDHAYRTIEMIKPGGACSINILYDATKSYLLENYKQHWEVHIRGTTQEQKDRGGFMAGGVDLRILVSFKFPLFLDVITDIKKGEDFAVKVVYGDIDRTWEKIPEHTTVTFNGIAENVNEEGIATFVFPETRGDYEYKIDATSNQYYIPVTMMLAEDAFYSKDNNSIWSIFSNIYVIIIIIVAIIAIVIFMWWWRN